MNIYVSQDHLRKFCMRKSASIGHSSIGTYRPARQLVLLEHSARGRLLRSHDVIVDGRIPGGLLLASVIGTSAYAASIEVCMAAHYFRAYYARSGPATGESV